MNTHEKNAQITPKSKIFKTSPESKEIRLTKLLISKLKKEKCCLLVSWEYRGTALTEKKYLQNPVSNIYLMVRNLEGFLITLGIRQVYPLLSPLFKIILEALADTIRQEKEI